MRLVGRRTVVVEGGTLSDVFLREEGHPRKKLLGGLVEYTRESKTTKRWIESLTPQEKIFQKCKTCLEIKALAEFSLRRPGGRTMTVCKICRARRDKGPNGYAHHVAYLKTKNGRLARRRAARKYKERFPDKVRAREAFSSALRRGDITRRATCEECGSRNKVDGHHDDYSKPLVVRWLCHSCHCAYHKKIDTYVTGAAGRHPPPHPVPPV